MALPILVVEDDGLIRMDLVDTLSDCGFNVLEAANADQALHVLGGSRVAALLTDIDMPGSMNGIGLAQIASERWPEVKIIVISGRYSPAQGSLPDGARFISKPISENVIARAMADLDIRP